MKKQKRNPLENEVLECLFGSGAFRFISPSQGDYWFPYTSGQVGPYYVQSMNIWKTTLGISRMNEAFEAMDWRGVDLITCGERRDWPFASAVSSLFHIPCLHITKDGEWLGGGSLDLDKLFPIRDPHEYSRRDALPSAEKRKIVHVADLNNEGASLRQWDQYVKEAGGKISKAVFLVDRCEEGLAVAEELGIETESVVKLDKVAWDYLEMKNLVSPDVSHELFEYWRNRHEWGCDMLLRYPQKLAQMRADEKSFKKAQKIIETYEKLFPGFEDQIEKVLNN